LAPGIPWKNADIESRNLHTIGEFFPSRIPLFNILNMCSDITLSFVPEPHSDDNMVFSILNTYSILGR